MTAVVRHDWHVLIMSLCFKIKCHWWPHVARFRGYLWRRGSDPQVSLTACRANWFFPAVKTPTKSFTPGGAAVCSVMRRSRLEQCSCSSPSNFESSGAKSGVQWHCFDRTLSSVVQQSLAAAPEHWP